MQRRKFIRSSVAAAAAVTTGLETRRPNPGPAGKEMYELREYSLHFGGDQGQLEGYFRNALIPALNKYGVKAVGVFREWGKSEPARMYLLIPFPSMDQYLTIMAKVKGDADFQRNSATYNSVPADRPVFDRYTSAFLIAFDGLPQMVVPSTRESRIFELRTYEGYSEDALRRKIKMFNEGEFPIFNRTGLHPVFFGERIAGEHMPCLTYMVTFRDMEERDRNWNAFGADPDWKKLSADPQYANSVSNIIKVFLVPTEYSQV
ncbi:MAG TPA: NIPSNAP family protein [Chitinophagaceae bacterium]|nr:NIPSNAP family protein [Chitinophagaceae bacterium]